MGFLLGLKHQRSAFCFPEIEQAEEREDLLPNKFTYWKGHFFSKGKASDRTEWMLQNTISNCSAKHTALSLVMLTTTGRYHWGLLWGAEGNP